MSIPNPFQSTCRCAAVRQANYHSKSYNINLKNSMEAAASASAKELGYGVSNICSWKSSSGNWEGCVCCAANWLWQEPML